MTASVGSGRIAAGGGQNMAAIGMVVETRSTEEELLTPSEVAKLFRVDPKTVTRWAKSGKLSSIRTLGGHRRYRASEVRQLLEGQQTAD
jgi:excisionase family DNA binding protein